MISKRIVVICILLLPAIFGYSRQDKVNGKVTDDHGKPVELCVIKAAHSNYSTHSDAHGEFSLAYNVDSSHSLIISCPGYETQEVSISDDALWVVLKHKVHKLGDATIKAGYDVGELKKGVLGKKSLRPYGICSDIMGSENAIFLSADPARHGILQEVFFYITKEGVPDSKFKVHVYNMDTAFMPGEELLDSNVIVHANAGDEWVRADISSRHIPVGRGVFISMEWLSGSGNNPNIVTGNEHYEQWKFNTMVLGMTRGYHNRGAVGYERGNFYHEWHHMDFEPDPHARYINPMMYATYTYRKK